LFAAAGWTKWGSVTKDSLLTGLAALRREGLSHQTSNHYRTHAKGFAAWLADGAGVRDPLVRVGGKLSVEVDRRHPRRSPDDVEMCRLFDHLDSPRARLRRGMTGPQRALGYRVAMATGLRAGELRSLTRESFDLEAGTVAVEAAYSKHRRRDVVQLPAWLVVELRAWFGAGGECWVAIPERFPGRLLRDDLRLAGVPVETTAGYFDMHSLRVWFCTAAANMAGISPKTLMTVCRHSTAQLTLGVYAKARLADVRAVAEAIPDVGRAKPQKAAERRA
jgi:integrase